MLRSDPAQPERISKHALRPMQRILAQPLRFSAYAAVVTSPGRAWLRAAGFRFRLGGAAGVRGPSARRIAGAKPFPNLKAMFSRSAGVETFINHPKLPKAPLGKVESAGGDPMMTEYVVMHVLRLHRDVPEYQAAQARREWRRTRIVRSEETGLGFSASA